MAAWGALGLAVCGALLVALAGRAAKAAVAVVVLSVLLSYLVAPAATRLRRLAHRRHHHLSALQALVAVYVSGSALVWAVVAGLGGRFRNQVGLLADTVPGHVDRVLHLTESIDRWQEWLGWARVPTSTFGAAAFALSDWVRLHVADVLVDALDYRWVLPWTGLIPVLSFLLLTQFTWFRRSTLRGLPRGHLRWRGGEFLAQVNAVLAGYVRAQVLSALVVALLCMVGFALLRVPYALLVGAATGGLELLPMIGPIAAALLVVGLVRGGRLLAALLLLLAVRLLQDMVIYPRLMGRSVHLPAPAVLGAVWAGATLGGILGVLMAVPVVAIGAVAVRHWRDYRAIEGLVRLHEHDAPTRPEGPHGAGHA